MARPFDFDEVFDDDYLYFYETLLTPERSDAEADVIEKLIGPVAGKRILDLACGHGRIANRLAERGAIVTGLDVTEGFLDVARKDAAGRGVSPTFVSGDMRSLPWTEEFDAVVNWFTSFGYFGDDDNRRVLAEAHRALVPGGRMLVEHMNRDRALRNLQASVVSERDGNLLVDVNEYVAQDGVFASERIVVRDGVQRRFRFTVRVFSLPELRGWLEDAGFSETRGFNEAGDAYDLESRRMLVLATK